MVGIFTHDPIPLLFVIPIREEVLTRIINGGNLVKYISFQLLLTRGHGNSLILIFIIYLITQSWLKTYFFLVKDSLSKISVLVIVIKKKMVEGLFVVDKSKIR